MTNEKVIMCPNCADKEISIYVMLGGIVKHRGELHLLQTSMDDGDSYIPLKDVPWVDIETGACSECGYEAPVPEFIYGGTERGKYDVALYKMELDGGLTKHSIKDLLEMLPRDIEMDPISITEDDTTVMGFANINRMKELNVTKGSLVEFIRDTIEDDIFERADGIYTTSGGLKVFMLWRTEISNKIQEEVI